jgi:hypothetical protein
LTGSADPQATAEPRGARSRFAPRRMLLPNSGLGFRNRKIMTAQGRRARRMLVSSLVSPVRGRERCFGVGVPQRQPVLDRRSHPGKKPSRGMFRVRFGRRVVTWTGGSAGAALGAGRPMHARSPPICFGCTTLWGTYMTVRGLDGQIARGPIARARSARAPRGIEI